jgi:Co/Zn/Cd efflux system component
MDSCCEPKAEELTVLRGAHKTVLIVVFVINAVLFVVEAAAGLLANSTALLAALSHMLETRWFTDSAFMFLATTTSWD